MGDYDLKTREAGPNATLQRNFPLAVAAALAAYRDRFREIMGSEPIVQNPKPGEFEIATYGGGEWQVVGKFFLSELPGCCGVAVFYHASTTKKFQGRGLGKLFLQVRMAASILAGYTVGQATVLKYNKQERAILEAGGWKEVWSFRNGRTSNDVIVYLKQLV